QSISDVARYPGTGTVRYTRTVTLTATTAGDVRKGNAVIVVHGIDYSGNGIYDDVLDRSDLNASLPGEATAPALCGALAAAKTASVSHETLYAASFSPTPDDYSSPSSALLCHLAAASSAADVRRT